MNREIKFRGWEKNRKVMIDLHKLTPLATTIENHDGLYLPFVDNIELMQFTGLKDKNGKEIYEGDILKRGGIVNWEEDLCSEYGCVGWRGITEGSYDGYHTSGRDEVVGNIYENPELLEVE